MEKQKLLIALVCVSILIASGIIGFCVVSGSKIIANAIKEKGIAGLSDFRNRPRPDLAAAKMPEPGTRKVKGVTAGRSAIKGDSKAKVLIVEFSDFQCPFSRRFFQGVLPRIEKEYISTGKVKFAYRYFPLGFHPLAVPAAMACECAKEQGKFWQMFDKISNSDSLENESLNKFAADIGLNTDGFNKCLDSQKTKAIVDADMKEGLGYGVKGTPAFFVNGRFIEGALPFEAFKKIIDEELKSK